MHQDEAGKLNKFVYHRRFYAFMAVSLLAAASVAWAEDRSIDGTGNNLNPSNNTQGAADTPIVRINYPAFFPGDGSGSTMIEPPARPNAREISNQLSDQTASNPNSRGLSDFIWQWGQFLTHDMDLTGTNPANGVVNIVVPTGDPDFDPTSLGGVAIPFSRSNFQVVNGIREQINEVTSYIDASNIYGSDAARAAALRQGTGGLLNMSSGSLLPLNNDPGNLFPNDNNGPVPDNQLFLTGDVRANEQVGLTSMHVIFHREHNRLAALIDATHTDLPTDPVQRDEEIYQRARKIVGAEMQAITYGEFLPALMGSFAPKAQDVQYNSLTNASITQTFSHALFRFGHSMNGSTLRLVDDNGAVSSLALRDAFFNPDFLKNDPTNVDNIIRGLSTQFAEENDLEMVDEIRNFLFGPPGAGGLDLMSLDVQRGRDHGLPSYTETYAAYLPQVTITSVTQITSDTGIQQALTDLYDANLDQVLDQGEINNIDLFVGALAEDHLPDASIGLISMIVIQDQFARLRDGDRFFFLNDPDLYSSSGLLRQEISDIIDLDTITLADIIQFNTGITGLQSNVFFVPEPTSGLVMMALVSGYGLTRRKLR